MGDVFSKIVAGRGASPAGICSQQANASGGLTTLVAAEAKDVLGITGSQTRIFCGQTVDATGIPARAAALPIVITCSAQGRLTYFACRF